MSMFDGEKTMDDVLTKLNERTIAENPASRMFLTNLLPNMLPFSKPAFAAQIVVDGLLEDYRKFANGLETEDFHKLVFRWHKAVKTMKSEMQSMDDSQKNEIAKKS